LTQLQRLKTQKPKLTFDFTSTKYQKIHLQMIYNDHDHDDDDEYTDHLQDILERETKAQAEFWPHLQKIFNLSDLVIDENGYAHLQTHQYTSVDWARDHEFFL
jgi:hypothetical protein